MSIEQQLSKMTKSQKDFIGVFGNQWAPRKTTPFAGTCELCVWGSGAHDSECPVFNSAIDRLCASIDSGEYAGQWECGKTRAPGNWPHSSGCE